MSVAAVARWCDTTPAAARAIHAASLAPPDGHRSAWIIGNALMSRGSTRADLLRNAVFWRVVAGVGGGYERRLLALDSDGFDGALMDEVRRGRP